MSQTSAYAAAKYTVERFFTGCSDKTKKMLKAAWKEGDQLVAKAVPKDGIVPVVLMAAWGMRTDVELVDSYDDLLERARETLADGKVTHPDSFFVSSLCILAARGEAPTIGSFEQLNIPNIFSDLLGLDEEEEDA